jgi:choline kinase
MVSRATQAGATPVNQGRLKRAVLLSAGQGKRLLPLTEDRPKCSLSFRGRSVVEWQIDALFAAGIEEVCVVLGYGAAFVERLLGQRYGGAGVRTLYNPFYRLTDNLATCWIAREAMADDFLLINGDTLFEAELVGDLVDGAQDPITLTVDHKDAYDADDMKVITDASGRPQRIGKQLPASDVSAESIGMIAFTGTGPGLFNEAVERAMRSDEALSLWYLSVIDQLAQQGAVGSWSVGSRCWSEMDDHDDLEAVDAVVAAIAGLTGAATQNG